MYFCNNCERFFENGKVIEEKHPYGNGTATEYLAVCPYCENTDFQEAEKCNRCGEHFAELHNGLCDCCWGDLYGE